MSEPTKSAEPSEPLNRLPPQTLYIVGNEACERFSFYGMTGILMLYMMNVLKLAESDATTISHLFKTAVYLLPLAGAYIADRWLGRYRTILYISLFYCLGHAVLSVSEGNRMGLYLGLTFIAIGSGGIKPCVSAFVGDQFGPGRQHLLPKIYAIFYWAINFGSFFAFGLIPNIRENYGYRWAFGIPGLAMGLATLIFWLGRKHYVHVPPTRNQGGEAGIFAILWHALTHQAKRQPGQSWLDVASSRYSKPEVDGAKAILGILMVFASVPVFWSLYDQTNSTWVTQGNAMTPVLFWPFQLDPAHWKWSFPFIKVFFSELAEGSFGFKLDAERMQSLNALLVMIIIPICTSIVYPLWGKTKFPPSPLRRMSAGMLLAALSFVVCGWVQNRIDHGEILTILWQGIPYVLLTAGEVLLSATALEFAFSQAPKTRRSTVMSLWLMTTAAGNFLVAMVTHFSKTENKTIVASDFYFYAILMFVVAAAFIVCAMRYKQRPLEQ